MSPTLRLGDIIKLYHTLFYIHNKLASLSELFMTETW